MHDQLKSRRQVKRSHGRTLGVGLRDQETSSRLPVIDGEGEAVVFAICIVYGVVESQSDEQVRARYLEGLDRAPFSLLPSEYFCTISEN